MILSYDVEITAFPLVPNHCPRKAQLIQLLTSLDPDMKLPCFFLAELLVPVNLAILGVLVVEILIDHSSFDDYWSNKSKRIVY